MKKTLYIAFSSLLLILSSFTVVSATESENVTRRRPDRDEAKAAIQEVRTERQESREDRQGDRQEVRSHVAENHATRLENSFLRYQKRFANILDRFQKRLDILKTNGKDTAKVQGLVDSAKAKLTDAKAKGDGAVAAFRAIDPAKFSEQKTQLLAARDLALQAHKLYLELHQLLKTALIELKTISQAQPTSSASVQKAN